METLDLQNNFWTYENLNSVHVELSSKCNAACPGCSRFEMNSPIVKESLKQQSVSLDQFKNWFPPKLVPQIINWLFCGTYGDPLAANDIYEILKYLCENGAKNIQINTNAGLRSPSLFKKIGELFVTHSNDYKAITFSIDGLADTNHIYRRNVIWNKVWENLMAYRSTGAKADWDFLQFKHNVHQVDEARELAKKHGIGFFLKNPFGVDKTSMPVYNKNLELDYLIEHATDNGYPTYHPAKIGYVAPMPAKIEAEGCITCMSKRPAHAPYNQHTLTEIYIDSLGNVLPCCFVSVGMVGGIFDWGTQVQQIHANMELKNNLNHYSIKEILDSGILETWSNSWKNKSIAACWQFCGRSVEKHGMIDNLWVDK